MEMAYISWAQTNYGGYTYANAVEFSTIQAERLGWASYGDTQYVSHVLRYYPFGRAFTGGGNQVIVEVALTQLGNEADSPTGHGMVSAVGKNGAPALFHGVQNNAAISKVDLSRNLQDVSAAQTGLKNGTNGRTEIMSLLREILFSSIGKAMVQPTM